MTGVKNEADVKSAAARIRDNQRRSRARRKEYVENLQQRLDEYERKGVEATLDMQHAARSVAIENSKLRVLLSRNGLGADEVDRFLLAYRGQGDELEVLSSAALERAQYENHNPHNPHYHQFQHQRHTSQSYRHQAEDGVPQKAAPPFGGEAGAFAVQYGHESYGYGGLPPPASSLTPPHSSRSTQDGDSALDRLAVLASASAHQGSCDSATQSTTSNDEPHLTSPSSLGPSPSIMTPVSNCPNPLSPVDRLSTSPMEMSCNMAAQIIAEMQGQGDRDATKDQLGCNGQKECLVKNMSLFHILDRGDDS